MNFNDEDRARRAELVRDVENTRTDAFPGSREWLAACQAEKALRAFDLLNPGLAAQIRKELDLPYQDPWEV